MKPLKTIAIILIIVSLVTLMFFFFAFKGTTWGGWTPPDASLQLNTKEKRWAENIEKEYKGTFDYIGLDDEYAEDSIIHITFNCLNKPIFEINQITDKEQFTKKLCKNFLYHCENKRSQNYIKFSYDNLKVSNEQYPDKLVFLYDKISGKVLEVK